MTKQKAKLKNASFMSQTNLRGKQTTGVVSNIHHTAYLSGNVVVIEYNDEDHTIIYVPLTNIASYEFDNETN